MMLSKTLSSCTLILVNSLFLQQVRLLREYPELVSRIHDDGNQISSHYNFHDLMYTQSDSEIEKIF